MKAVLYSREDFEPITVVELSMWAWECLDSHRYIVLPILDRMPAMVSDANAEPVNEKIKTVAVSMEKIRMWDGKTMRMLFVDDDETALLLKSAFLSGQYRAVEDERHAEFARGFLHALSNY